MRINIYYGGRGLVDDPTLFVINEMQKVLEELNVTVERFNLYEMKNAIPTLPQTLKTADGIILASTVEWYGIGGYMQSFLDACWLYGDKEKIGKIYMCPIVMSTTYGEREGKLNLSVAWEILGGLPCSGICGYIKDTSILENNQEYRNIEFEHILQGSFLRVTVPFIKRISPKGLLGISRRLIDGFLNS